MSKLIKNKNIFFNEDCIKGCKEHLEDNSIDLIITDPPYGINGDTLHKHYNRKEEYVLDGYIEVPKEEYAKFSEKWIEQAERILRPGGSIYIFSGYTNLIDILNALKKTKLKEINHLIWKYNFGVYTKKKYVSSHYHILYYFKPGGERIFNAYSRFGQSEKERSGKSLNYKDREDVFIVNREYKPGKFKNKNELPKELLIKLLQYSSNEKDLVCDLFLGSFSTAKIAIGLNRYAIGFEKSKSIYDYQIFIIDNLKMGYLLPKLKIPEKNTYVNQGKPWIKEEKERLIRRYKQIYNQTQNKKRSIEILSKEFKRGYFSILNILKK